MNIKHLLLAGAAAIITTGCANVAHHSTISPLGEITVKSQYDFSNTLTAVKNQTSADLAPTLLSEKEFCQAIQQNKAKADLTPSNSFHIKNLTCEETAPGVFMISFEDKLYLNSEYINHDWKISVKFNAIVDRIKTLKVQETVQTALTEMAVPSNALSKEDLIALSQTPFTTVHTVTFPGQIAETTIGSVRGNQLTVDLSTDSDDEYNPDNKYWVSAHRWMKNIPTAQRRRSNLPARFQRYDNKAMIRKNNYSRDFYEMISAKQAEDRAWKDLMMLYGN